MSRSVVIVDGIRTPFAKAGGELQDVPVGDLGRSAVRELLQRTALDPETVDELILGCVGQPSRCANPARVVALRAGLPENLPAHTVARNCASGLEALTEATERICSGRAAVVIAAGAESMSRYPLLFPLSFGQKLAAFSRARNIGEKISAFGSFRLADLKPRIALLEGLSDPFSGELMGVTAERLAREFGIGREQQDRYALRSHQRAVESREFHAGEIASVAVPPALRRVVNEDIGPRDGQSMKALAKLKPYFDRKNGSVTVGNSCGITDGAVALLLMEEQKARSLGYTPLGKVLGHGWRGCDPLRMGLGPVHATPIALAEAGLNLSDISRIELNEAFACQVLACVEAFSSSLYCQELGLSCPVGEVDETQLNVHGGAIALGHPVGATGARLVLTLLRELREQGGGLGLATLCIGGGQGGAMVVEGWSG